MRRTFLNDTFQKAFAETGYVVIPCLDPSEVKRLRELFEQFNPAPQKGFQVSLFTHPPAARLAMSKEMNRALESSISRHFDNYRFVVGSFVVKWPGVESEVAVHQDWAFVDETRFSSVNIWCPLVDTDERNGTLCVVPGSHRVIPNWFRGSPPILSNHSPFEGLKKEIALRHGIEIPVRAGDAIAYNHSLLHFSQPNGSTEPRIAVAGTVVPREATLLHHFLHETGQVETFEVTEEFLATFEIGKRPQGMKCLGQQAQEIRPVSLEAFDAIHSR